MPPTLSTGRRAAVVSCDVIAWASVRSSAEEIPALRKAPGRLGEGTIPPALLKNADEQTVVGLAAVLKAVEAGGLDPSGFGAWAVLAAPRFLGRAEFLRSFPQYRNEGAWGVSPHLIAAHSLHSPSGAISQALKAHGTNLGVGGTPGSEDEAMLLAASLLATGWQPGVWVVLTGRPPGLDRTDDQAGPGHYEALALALVHSSPDHRGVSLRIGPDSVILTGVPDDDRGRVSPWFATTGLRSDPGHDPSATGPRPHIRPGRSGTPGETRGKS